MEEIFAFLIEIFAEVLIEVFFQIILQFVIELIIRVVLNLFSKEESTDTNPFYSAIGYVAIALLLAAASVYFFPTHVLKNENLRRVNLMMTPLIVGLVMSQRRKQLIKKQKVPLTIDSFVYGFSFTLTFALIRFVYCI